MLLVLEEIEPAGPRASRFGPCRLFPSTTGVLGLTGACGRMLGQPAAAAGPTSTTGSSHGWARHGSGARSVGFAPDRFGEPWIAGRKRL